MPKTGPQHPNWRQGAKWDYGEDKIVTQPATKKYAEGWDRIFGKKKKEQDEHLANLASDRNLPDNWD